ncbi:MAG: hypothetical protein JWM95_809 [Gemmatimonadetes bacterium]|nr:hypothetical protein [Gemmatimonadota bacterium]
MVSASVPGSEIDVTLVTIGLGEEVFERFGHDALIFRNALTGATVAYHWGQFSFDQPGFLRRFLTGDTRYWMGADDPRGLIERERMRGRPVTLQLLNLSPAQALSLLKAVETNSLEENKYYRYDYFRDNCATRLRDALDGAVGGALKRQTEGVPTDITYRRESIRLTDGDRPVQAGIDIALGRPADVPISEWKSFFIPMRLRDAARVMRIPGANGTQVPLVAKEWMVALPATTTPIPEATVAPHITLTYLYVGILFAVLIAGLRMLMMSHRAAAYALAFVGTVWSLLCGVLGVILLLAWMATQHVFWAYNENVLLLTPLSLALVVLLPIALLSGKAARPARMVAAINAAMGLVSLCLAIIPGGQESSPVVALLLPAQLAIAWALALPQQKHMSELARTR